MYVHVYAPCCVQALPGAIQVGSGLINNMAMLLIKGVTLPDEYEPVIPGQQFNKKTFYFREECTVMVFHPDSTQDALLVTLKK